MLRRRSAARCGGARARRRTTAEARGARRSGIAGWGAAGASRAPRSAARGRPRATSATGAAGTPRRGQALVPVRGVRRAQALSRSAHERVAVPTRSGFARSAGRRRARAPRSRRTWRRRGGRSRLRSSARRRPWGTPGTARPWGTACLPPGHRAVRQVAGEVVPDVPEGGLVEGDVDLGADPVRSRSSSAATTPSAAHVPVPWSISDAPTRTPGPARLPRHRDEAAGRLHQRVVARLVRERADFAVRADRAVDEPRVARPHRIRARARAPRRAPVAGSGGRRLPRSASRRSASRPRGSRSDNARERLPAFAERNIVPSPFQNGGPHARPSSPVSGRSTLTTSAPSAARICAQYGPAIDVVTSSTRMPVSGACAMRA